MTCDGVASANPPSGIRSQPTSRERHCGASRVAGVRDRAARARMGASTPELDVNARRARLALQRTSSRPPDGGAPAAPDFSTKPSTDCTSHRRSRLCGSHQREQRSGAAFVGSPRLGNGGRQRPPHLGSSAETRLLRIQTGVRPTQLTAEDGVPEGKVLKDFARLHHPQRIALASHRKFNVLRRSRTRGGQHLPRPASKNLRTAGGDSAMSCADQRRRATTLAREAPICGVLMSEVGRP